MKRIFKEYYNGDGIYIDLDNYPISHKKLMYESSKYLNKNEKYYFHCKMGVKSLEVVKTLDMLGYNVTQVI